MPRLSLCLIARDESRFIAGCLESVAGVVDEIVVVDTGSEDATVSIAESMGASVVHHAWRDDFAAARNAALEASSGDWILVLDADERLAPGAGAALREAIRGDGFDCGLLPLHNADALEASARDVLAGTARIGEPVALPRLMRRSPGLRWWGAIHETVGPWVASGRAVRLIDAPIVHFGAIPSVRDERDKGSRNRALLERHLAHRPDDAWARAYFAWELLDAGDAARAARQAERAWSDAVRAKTSDDGLGRVRDLSQAATLRAFTQLQRGDNEEALATLREATELGVDHPNVALLRAAALDTLSGRSRAELEAAAADLKVARSRHGMILPTTPIPGATSWGAATLEAALRTRLGDPDTALRLLDTALNENPDHTQAILAGAEAFLAKRAGPAALSAIESQLSRPSPDVWTIAARAAYVSGDAATAAAFARRARESERQGWAAQRRRPDLQQLEQTLQAEALLTQLLGGRAEPSRDLQGSRTRASQALEQSDPSQAVAHAAAVLSADINCAEAWGILSAGLMQAGLRPQSEQAAAMSILLDPFETHARTTLAELERDRGQRESADRHLRYVQPAPTDATPSTDDVANTIDAQVGVLCWVRDIQDTRGLLAALAMQHTAPPFTVHLITTQPDAFSSSPVPLQLHPSAGAALDALKAHFTLVITDDRRPAPSLLARHVEAQSKQPGLLIGGSGMESIDHPSEFDQVFAALGPTEGGHFFAPIGHCSLPTERLRTAGVATLTPHGLRPPEDMAPSHPADLTCQAPRAHAPSLDLLLRWTRTSGQHEASTQARARSVAALERDLADRSALEADRKRASRLIGALERSAHRINTLTPDALKSRVDALQTALTAERSHARVVEAARVSEPQPPLIDCLTSVVMLNLNGAGHLYGAVNSLRETTLGPVELIVVDNGSTDESLDWLRKQSDIILLEMGENIGAPAGRNRGLEVARGETVLFCDNDVVFTPRWRELLIEHLTAWPDIGAVGPMSDVVVGSQLVDAPPSADVDLAVWATQFSEAHRGRSMWTLRLILFCMMFRRSALEEIGGIDPRYGRWGFEDDDLSLRLARAGWHQRVAGDCFIQHLGSRTAKSANIDYQALLVENWGKFKARWGLSADLPYGSPIPLDEILAADWDRERDFVPFRRPDQPSPEGPLSLLRWRA